MSGNEANSAESNHMFVAAEAELAGELLNPKWVFSTESQVFRMIFL
jgi:hypothetical protein